MLNVLLGFALCAAPSPAAPKPGPVQIAKVMFQGGDLVRAIGVAQACRKKTPKECEPLVKALAEYQLLASEADTLTPAQAKAFLKWDAIISPNYRGKLTRPVWARFVEFPLVQARAAYDAGDLDRAKVLVQSALSVAPESAEVLAIVKGQADAGVPGVQSR